MLTPLPSHHERMLCVKSKGPLRSAGPGCAVLTVWQDRCVWAFSDHPPLPKVD